MTVHAPTGHGSVTIPVSKGGCGEPHAKADDEPRLSVDCPLCEPAIMKMAGHGWAYTPEGVHLNPDERREVEQQENAARRAQARTLGDPVALSKVFAESMRDALGTGQGAPAPTLLEQIAALSAEDRAALKAMLGADSAPVEAVDTPEVKASVTDGVPTSPPVKTTPAAKTTPPPAAPRTSRK